jgi:hypothetical protein
VTLSCLAPRNNERELLWLSKTPSELKARKSRLHADNSLPEKLIEVPVQQRCNGVLNRKAGSAEKIRSRLVTRLLWFIRRTEAIVAEDRLTLSGVALYRW